MKFTAIKEYTKSFRTVQLLLKVSVTTQQKEYVLDLNVNYPTHRRHGYNIFYEQLATGGSEYLN